MRTTQCAAPSKLKASKSGRGWHSLGWLDGASDGLLGSNGSHKDHMTAFHYVPLAQLSEKIRSREISPRELVNHHVERIARLQPVFNAFVHIDRTGALERAQAAEDAVLCGQPLGPLHGVPITVKSCIEVAGWPCAA